jgi:uncharacterized protein YhbP (UPF0306 family)
MDDLQHIEAFIAKHHILTLATSNNNIPQCATLFYVYDPLHVRFIVASDEKTEHIANALHNPNIAGAIALETKEVGKIEGLQFTGKMVLSESDEDAALYYKAFPYARVMQPTFWILHVKRMKLTDNRLGFGKKVMWPEV